MTPPETSADQVDGRGGRARVSVVVPAHNEELVIERCLRSLLAGAITRELELVVICNGCVDATAEIARLVAPQARVVELPVGSKHSALNAGDAEAQYFPRCYVDADVVVSPGALDAVADVLDGGQVLVAAPRPLFDTSRSGLGARLFLRLWERSPYFQDDLVGSGFYALAGPGRRRFDRFPPVVADDYFIASMFPRPERRAVDGCTFTPLLPVSLRGIVDIHIRHYAAHGELGEWLRTSRELPELQLEAGTSGGWLRPYLSRPGWWPSLAVYLGVKVAARAGGAYKRRFGSMANWNRDDRGRAGLTGTRGPA